MLGQLLHTIRSRPYTSSLILLALLLLLSALHRPTAGSTSYQFPGFLPSRQRLLGIAASGDERPVYPFPQLTREQERRYSHLRTPYVPGHNSRLPKPSSKSAAGEARGKYLLVTLTRNIESQLPDILNAMIVLTSFLGSHRVRFSFYEGPSSDATPKVLNEVLIPILLKLGVPSEEIIIRTDSPKAEWDKTNRIQLLAALRNEAISPLWSKPEWDDTAAVVFFNDVFLRARDILELLHQHVKAGEKAGAETGMTTGIDWWKRHPAYFYDIWVARTMEGDIFYPMESTTWQPSDDFLSTSPPSRESYEKLKPFQAFSAWNGMAVIAATPFLSPMQLRFRRSDLGSGECRAAEPEILCRDLWRLGFGRIQVVPSVQLAYERDAAIDTAETLAKRMEELEWREESPKEEDDHIVEFVKEPPSKVRCHEWPEKFGLDGNVWAETTWGEPYAGYSA